jgi:molybdopterin synthase catalytic subunit
MIDIKITAEPIDVTSCLYSIASPECGGCAIFLGTVRDKTKDRKVLKLEFECYEKMAIKKMEEIALKSVEKWQVQNVLIHHRIGEVGIMEAAVLIIVTAPHRNDAFAACQYAIDTLKETVPIWKKEIFEDGEVWVAAHP